MCEPFPYRLTRRKLVRFSIGNARSLRICSINARSDSRRSADRGRLRRGSAFFTERPSQYREHGAVLRPIGGTFAANDVLQRRHPDGVPTETSFGRAAT